MMATCVDLAGAKYPARFKDQDIQPLEGVSLAPAFAGKDIGRKQPIFFEHEGNRAVRQGKWKLVAKHRQSWELYDIDADRSELNDLSKVYPDRTKEIVALYDAWAKRASVQPWPVRRKRK